MGDPPLAALNLWGAEGEKPDGAGYSTRSLENAQATSGIGKQLATVSDSIECLVSALTSQPDNPMAMVATTASAEIWTLDLVKNRVATGKPIPDSDVVDVGDNTLVKYGTRPCREEAEATQYVAQLTSVRVPKIYALLYDETTKWTYIVQEKLPGTPLMELLPTMEPAALTTIALELKEVLLQLAALDTLGPMGHFGRPSDFGDCMPFPNFSLHKPIGPITTTESFVHWIPRQILAIHRMDRMPPPGAFDLSRPPIFSHGDFVPENILILDGHVSGIIDWERAGWYPYFWNDYMARWRQKMRRFQDGKWLSMLPAMMDQFETEFQAFEKVYSGVNIFL